MCFFLDSFCSGISLFVDSRYPLHEYILTLFLAMDQPPHGFLYNFWNSLHEPRFRDHVAKGLTQGLVVNIDAVINALPRIHREGYSITHLSSKFLISSSLTSQFCYFIYYIVLVNYILQVVNLFMKLRWQFLFFS